MPGDRREAGYRHERARLDDVPAQTRPDLPRKKLAQQLHGEVALRHPAHLGEKFVRKDGDVRFFQPRGCEDVHDLARDHRLRYDLPDGEVQLLVRLPLPRGALGENRPDRLEEADVFADAQRLFVGNGEGEGLR